MSDIKIKLADKIEINIDIQERITFIGGNSGTGKTFLANLLSDIKGNESLFEIEGIDTNIIKVIKDNDTAKHIKFNDYEFIVMDNYDTYSKKAKERIWRRMSKLINTWVLISRHPDIPHNWGFSHRSFTELKSETENGTLKIELVEKS